FPHYFERQRTDGVDHTLYVGRSLVEDGQFDELYLRNLRLWQLMVTCGIARRTEAVLPRPPLPLATPHPLPAPAAPAAASTPPGPTTPATRSSRSGSTRRWGRSPTSGSRSPASWRSRTR